MAHKKDRTGWKHDSGVYRRFTLVPFAYALVLTVPAELMLLALDLGGAMVALVLAEVIVFLLLPHIPWVRRAVDERLEARARSDAAAARSVLLMRMSEVHRRELQSLEKIAASLYERSDMAAQGHAPDCTGIERLIELYVKLAIAHRVSCNSLEVIDHRPDEELATLEARAAHAERPQREWMDKRLEILRMRREARRAALDEQAAIRHDLALIGDTLRWMQESCASAGTENMRAELDFALTTRERDAATLRELATLRETDLDTAVIRLGRDPAPPTDQPHTRIAIIDDDDAVVIKEPDEITVRIWPKEAPARACALRAANDPTSLVGEPLPERRMAER
jgi:hypothetical protein